MSIKLFYLGVVLATGALVTGYALGGVWAWTPFIIGLGLLWMLGQRHGWSWIASLELVLYSGTATAGLWLDLAPGWILIGMVAALTAWDLDNFLQRLMHSTNIEMTHVLEQRYLKRFLMVDSLGLLMAAIALEVEARINFGVAILLGLLAVLGLSRAIGFLRGESD